MANRKPGGTTSFRPEYIEQARKLSMLGFTGEGLAKFFGVAARTIDNWIADHADFRTAVHAGRAVADAEVVAKLYHRATGYEHPAVKILVVAGQVVEVPYVERYPPDPTSMIFWLKNRQRALWTDRGQADADGVKKVVVENSPDDD